MSSCGLTAGSIKNTYGYLDPVVKPQDDKMGETPPVTHPLLAGSVEVLTK